MDNFFSGSLLKQFKEDVADTVKEQTASLLEPLIKQNSQLKAEIKKLQAVQKLTNATHSQNYWGIQAKK
jgi:hypothetical protein